MKFVKKRKLQVNVRLFNTLELIKWGILKASLNGKLLEDFFLYTVVTETTRNGPFSNSTLQKIEQINQLTDKIRQ